MSSTDQETGSPRSEGSPDPVPVAGSALAHDGLARMWARRAASGPVAYEDALQDARLGLLEACRRFDPGRGVKFSTYASYWIRRAIQRGASRPGSLPREPEDLVSLRRHVRRLAEELSASATSDGAASDSARVEAVAAMLGLSPREVAAVCTAPFQAGLDRLGEAIHHPVRDELDAVLDRLVARQALAALDLDQKRFVAERYGLDGSDGSSQRDIARRSGEGRRRTRRREAEALSQMRAQVGAA